MFRERREPSSLWAWILVMFFVPVFGFLLWVFVGRRLTREKIFAKLEGSGIDYDERTSKQTRSLTTGTLVPTNEVTRRHTHVVELLVSDDGARLNEDNRVEVFHDGREKFDRLIADLYAATDHVHVYYDIFRGDPLGTRIIAALTEAGPRRPRGAALRGRARWAHHRHVRPGRAPGRGWQGGRLRHEQGPADNLRVNNRTHRKLVVIDGTIGYIGGSTWATSTSARTRSSAAGATPTCVSPARRCPPSSSGC